MGASVSTIVRPVGPTIRMRVQAGPSKNACTAASPSVALYSTTSRTACRSLPAPALAAGPGMPVTGAALVPSAAKGAGRSGTHQGCQTAAFQASAGSSEGATSLGPGPVPSDPRRRSGRRRSWAAPGFGSRPALRVAFDAPDAPFGTGRGDPWLWAPAWPGVAMPTARRARSACPGGLETGAVRVARNAVPATKTAMAAAANPTPRRARVGGAAGDDGALQIDEDSVRSGGTRYRATSADAACQGSAGGTLGSPDSWRSRRDTLSPPSTSRCSRPA